jgi:predicted glycosyltransferase
MPASGAPAEPTQSKTIWIDLENSPHVPFFRPIVEELERRGHTVMVTARDCFQVCELADLFRMKYKRVGRHYGKNMLSKFAGLGVRTLQMTPQVLRQKPDLAVSHGSRSMFFLASCLRIPTLTILDYEHVRWMNFVQNSWIMVPEIVPGTAASGFGVPQDHLLRYPGIKEDVYAPSFVPDPSCRERLGFSGDDLVATIRPPASEAHYHNPESEKLLDAVFELMDAHPGIKGILLPRTPKQEAELRKRWPKLFQSGKLRVLDHVVDGLDLIWLSDLVISGGGTMNREAAALGVPVYSIFRGKLGAVDQYLSQAGRLQLVHSPADVQARIRLEKRDRTASPRQTGQAATFRAVVENILLVLNGKAPVDDEQDPLRPPAEPMGSQGKRRELLQQLTGQDCEYAGITGRTYSPGRGR